MANPITPPFISEIWAPSDSFLSVDVIFFTSLSALMGLDWLHASDESHKVTGKI